MNKNKTKDEVSKVLKHIEQVIHDAIDLEVTHTDDASVLVLTVAEGFWYSSRGIFKKLNTPPSNVINITDKLKERNQK